MPALACGASESRAAGGDGEGDEDHFRRQAEGDQPAERQVAREALPQLGEVDVEHHHDEEEQHGYGADVDHHQQHRQELRAHQHEEARRREEGEDQEQHRVHRVARRNNGEAG